VSRNLTLGVLISSQLRKYVKVYFIHSVNFYFFSKLLRIFSGILVVLEYKLKIANMLDRGR
jgi:hypothetical protein